MFDVSYGAAWELGRLLTLQKSQIVIDLFNWKRSYAQDLKQDEQTILHLSTSKSSTDNDDIPANVKRWFDDLSLLKHLPFNYLIPDETMLPVESIRFFRVDKLWVDCLLDRAFSIGRISQSNRDNDTKLGQSISGAVDEL